MDTPTPTPQADTSPVPPQTRSAGTRPNEPVTATIAEQGESPAPVPRALPGALGERYELRELLGEGGMGRVFRAFDGILHREVALKLVRVEGDVPAERLLREARAQSRVSHDHVCRVFDAGELDDQTYISMQLIAGPTLRQAAASLTRDERLELVAQAADGVHAAHRCGLVHRDLKPGNIMLERRPDGSWKAYVVDFGLVRDLDASTTATHAVAGTPHYMAPEQVRGAVDRIDWRADVWALGATLFELVAGQPPFAASSSAEVLVRVLRDEVQYPTHPRLPRDLRAILERCLEKEPERRYGSARELAADLRRFTTGLPVAARPAGPLQRLVKAARRNRPLAAVVTASGLALVVLGGLLAHTAWRSSEREQLARRFGEEAAAVESIVRHSALLPAHDVRRERRIVRARIDAIQRHAREVGELATGPGAYAVGRGWLALGDAVRAREELQRAWAAGYRTPDTAVALGQAMAAVYRRRLYEARGITNRELRQARERQLADELRDPALELLRSGGATTSTSPAYVEAVVALIEERWDDALAGARRAGLEVPWLYEATRLEGEIWLLRARAEANRGELTGAAISLHASGQALGRSIDLARSDPEARALECKRQLQLVSAAAKGATSPEPLLPRLRTACEAVLEVDPDAADSQCDLGDGFASLGTWQLDHGQDPGTALGEAVRLAEGALACDEESSIAHNLLGVAAWRLAQHERKSGRNARPWSERAIASFEQSAVFDPFSARPHGNRGLVLSDLAQDEREAGRDPLPLLGQALQAYGDALAVDPGLATVYFNRGVAGWRAGEWCTLHGLDARPHLRGAILDYRTAYALNPSLAPAPNALGAAYNQVAIYLDASGQGDPQPEWQEAERWYGEAIRRRPDLPNPHYNLSSFLSDQAERARDRGHDPLPILEKARREAAACLAIDARDNRNHYRLGIVEVGIASALVDRAQDPGPSLAAAQNALQRAHEMKPDDGVVWIGFARLHWARSRHLLRTAGAWDRELDRALTAIDRAQRLIPTSGQTRQVRAKIFLDRARASSAAARVKAARAALAAADDAQAHNPNITKELDDLRAEARKLLADR
ncbi:MAG: protein kinase [Thermoanaerobaculaceae bacterium]